jgi:hypothetical protein
MNGEGAGSSKDANGAATTRRWTLWIGWVLSVLPVLPLVLGAVMKLSHQPRLLELWVGKFGFPASTLVSIGILELLCVAVYVIPPTAVLGAVLLTGYVGGILVTHLRVGDNLVVPIMLGGLVWGGLYLREERLHWLLPFRRTGP